MTSRRLPPGIRRRGSSFTYTWRDATGKQISRKAGDTITEAIEYKTRIDADRLLGTFHPRSRLTFAEYATGWIETAPLKEQTRQRYRCVLRVHLLPAFGPIRLHKLHPHLIRSWLAEQTRGPAAANSVRQHVAVLKSCLRAAHQDGHLATLPTFGLRLPAPVRRRPKVLDLPGAFALVDGAPAFWRPCIATAVFTGLRLGELLALTRDDLDLDVGTLTVQATLSEVNGRTPRLLREPPKSDAGIRDVPIVPLLADMLVDHLEQLGPTEEDVVFATPAGALVDKRNFYRDAWFPTRRAAGHPTMHFHELRHTAASLMLAHAEANLSELKAVLGHSQIAHTVDIYGHLVPGRLDGIRDAFGAAVAATRRPATSQPPTP